MQTCKAAIPFELKGVSEDGTFKGYGSVAGNIDLGRDIVAHGAFRRSLKELADKGDNVKLLWQHNWHEPIGVYTSIKEDDKGLAVEGKLILEVQRAKEAYALLKAGAISGMSIGYNAKEWEYDRENRVRTIKDADLWEVSLVTFPMNPEARVASVKTVRDFEEFLMRDAGLTRKEAQIVINEGYKALQSSVKRDADDEGELVAMIEKQITDLKRGLQ